MCGAYPHNPGHFVSEKKSKRFKTFGSDLPRHVRSLVKVGHRSVAGVAVGVFEQRGPVLRSLLVTARGAELRQSVEQTWHT